MARMTALSLLAMQIVACGAQQPAPAPAGLLTTVAPAPAPAPATTGASSGPAPAAAAATTTAPAPAPVQSVLTTSLSVTSLASYSSAADFISQYSSNVASSSGGSVTTTIQSIVVKVSATLTPASLANNLPLVAQGFANQAGVPTSSVVVTVTSRRLFAEEQAPETESSERRLQGVQVQAAITADNSTDVLTAAKAIHAAVSNSTTLAAAIGNTTGTTVTASATVSFQVSVQAVITTTGGATVNASAVTASVSSGFNATVQITSLSSDAPTTAAPATTAAPTVVTTSVAGKKQDSYAQRSAGFVFVAFTSVFLAINAI